MGKNEDERGEGSEDVVIYKRTLQLLSAAFAEQTGRHLDPDHDIIQVTAQRIVPAWHRIDAALRQQEENARQMNEEQAPPDLEPNPIQGEHVEESDSARAPSEPDEAKGEDLSNQWADHLGSPQNPIQNRDDKVFLTGRVLTAQTTTRPTTARTDIPSPKGVPPEYVGAILQAMGIGYDEFHHITTKGRARNPKGGAQTLAAHLNVLARSSSDFRRDQDIITTIIDSIQEYLFSDDVREETGNQSTNIPQLLRSIFEAYDQLPDDFEPDCLKEVQKARE